jgi:hypothetical protein
MNEEIKIKRMYLVGVYAAAIVICLTLADIIIGSLLGGDLTMVPQFAVDRFMQLQEDTWFGMYNLDLLNLVVSVIMIPVFLALWLALKNEDSPFALLALIIFIIGTSVFIANNPGLSMLDISRKYNTATVEDQSVLFAAAGEAILAKGIHGGTGVFPGFFLITLSEMILSIVMLRTRIFSKATGYTGIAGTILLMVYLVLVTFVPSAKQSAMIIVAPGGILSLAWMVLFALKLIRMAR